MQKQTIVGNFQKKYAKTNNSRKLTKKVYKNKQ